MRRSELLPEVVDEGYVAELEAIAHAHGITHTGVARADPLLEARTEIERRRDLGLHDGMQFTFKNPDRSTDPGQAVAGARAVVVGARPYLIDEPPATDLDGVRARVARYAWVDHYAPLREGLWAVAARLRADGWKAVAYADDNSMVDRAIAYRAGIGWFGKNANLLVPGAGSWFVLGSVVTTAPLPATATPVADGCGSCRRCIDGCPTGAIIEPGVIDAGRCLAWQLQKPGIFPLALRRALGDRIYGCDDCQEVCPPTVHLGHRATVAPDASADLTIQPTIQSTIDVLELLDADDETILHRWGRWYLTDRDPTWHRRNALIVVGNVVRDQEPSTDMVSRVASVLGRYLAHDDPVLRAHAVWAARTARLDHLLRDDERNPLVVAEMTGTL